MRAIFYLLVLLLIPKIAIAKDQSQPFFTSDSVRISGKIINYSQDSGFTTGSLSIRQSIEKKTKAKVLPILTDGSFQITIPIAHPIYSYLEINHTEIPFYLCPGDSLYLSIEFKPGFLPLLSYSGRSALINKELYEANTLLKFQFIPYPEENNDSVRMAYHHQLTAAYQLHCKQLKKYFSKHHITSETRQLLRHEALLQYSKYLLQYDVQCVDLRSREFPDPATDPYYAFLINFPWNDSTLIALPSFDKFIAAFDYPIMGFKKWALSSGPQLFFKILKKTGHQLSAEEQELCEFFKTNTPENPLYKQKEQIVNDLQSQYSNNEQLWGLAEQLVIRRMLFEEDWQIKPGIIYEITKVRELAVSLEFCQTRAQALDHHKLIAQELTHPMLIRKARQITENAFPEKQTDFVLPLGKASDIFRNMIYPYQGKVILIDIWATWCPGCIEGITDLAPIREEYAEKDVVFLFVTAAGNAPLDAYHKIMDPVKGYKFRITDDEYNYLCELFQINTIPRYILVDREGKIMNADYKLQHLKETLDELLK